jgi:hypothetical protein
VPPDVRALVERYLRHVDQMLPGRIEGLYLVGSVALGDYRPGRSDVDFVAVTGAPLRPEELAGLEQVHGVLRSYQRRPDFSGIYVTWDDLQGDPVGIERVPYHLDGRFGRSGGFDANPAVWLTLRRYPFCVRGPARPSVWNDPAAVRRWNLDNLNSYWSRWAWRHRRLWGRGACLLTDEAIAWCVPGVTRLHYTISTGDIASKTGACRWALGTFPARWHPVLREALAIRTRERVRHRSRVPRGRDALAFMRFVIADTNRSAGAAGSLR